MTNMCLLLGYDSSLLLVPVLGRAKQCLDFTATYYGFHFIICWIYESVPKSAEVIIDQHTIYLLARSIALHCIDGLYGGSGGR
jgi:hypothetical protein